MGLIVDLFAGGGGASEGIRRALGRDPDVAVNHSRIAVAMHRANHPGTRHMIQDVWDVSPQWATHGQPVDLLWASPDCRHFSKAKGSAPRRDAKIRDLAWVVVKWAEQVRPRLILLENVEEIQTWGPLDHQGHIIPEQAGTTFKAFIRRLRRLGYAVQYRELRACDYGAPTTRKRLFLIARCDDKPIVWPVPTHGPGRAHPYRTAAECIDWSIPCPSIFLTPEEAKTVGVKRPLAEATMRRIYNGLRRYVLESASPYIVACNHSLNPSFQGQDIERPLGTITGKPSHAVVAPLVVKQNYGDKPCHGVEEPLHMITTQGNKHCLVSGYLAPRYGERVGQEPRAQTVEAPLATIVPSANGARLAAAFLAQHNLGVVGHDAREPMSTITSTGSQQQLVAASLVRSFGQSVGQEADAPVPCTTAGGGGKTGLMTSHLIKLRGTCQDGQPVDQPAPTITGGGMHIAEVRAFLMAYYGQGVGQDCRDPLRTITAGERFGLVTVAGEQYQIVDIGMRMLSPRELFRAQGFRDDYVIDLEVDGRPLSKADQVRCVGNSVCPDVAAALVRANYVEEREHAPAWSKMPLIAGEGR